MRKLSIVRWMATLSKLLSARHQKDRRKLKNKKKKEAPKEVVSNSRIIPELKDAVHQERRER